MTNSATPASEIVQNAGALDLHGYYLGRSRGDDAPGRRHPQRARWRPLPPHGYGGGSVLQVSLESAYAKA